MAKLIIHIMEIKAHEILKNSRLQIKDDNNKKTKSHKFHYIQKLMPNKKQSTKSR